MTSKTPKYALRKLSVGVTSVVLGIIVTNMNAHADDTPNQQFADLTDNISTQKETQQPYAPVSTSKTNELNKKTVQNNASATNVVKQSTPNLTQNTDTTNQATKNFYTTNKTVTTTNVVDAQRVRYVSLTVDGQSDPQYRYSERTPANLTTWKRVNVSGQYDIDAGQLKTGNKIKILTFSQKP